MISSFVTLLILCCAYQEIVSTELTFELPDNAKQCFYEEIKANNTGSLEFQVITGGQYDVDVVLKDPKGEILYQKQKLQFDTVSIEAKTTGVHEVCFSNEFSTFSHKIIYLDLKNGEEEDPLPGLGEHITALTQMETSTVDMHKFLNVIIDIQTRHRLREAHGRKQAEQLNEKVQLWALFETVIIIVIAGSQTIMLKSFFSDKRILSVSDKRLLGGH
ncbi:transmembrane emp24 domain-containing protein 3 [Dendroctonus ponderosae]|uniref:GOLD domain-containing protein n=1 Tax=Dendroctonus ponderosae TaxID=77166 RepID=J3JVH9_DENPD